MKFVLNYMKLTDQQLTKSFGHIEEHEYRHYNHSLGCFVEGKEHFKQLMEKGKFIPYDMCEKLAEDYDKNNPNKEYKISAKALDIIREIGMTADRKGNIQLGSRAIRALREAGLFPSDNDMERILKEVAKTNQ